MPFSPLLAYTETSLATLLTRLSSARGGYLDNLSAGAVALASAVAAIPLSHIQSVQYGSKDMVSLTSGTITISAVTVAKSILIPNGVQYNAVVADPSKYNCTFSLTNSTTITVARSISDAVSTIANCVVLELK